MEYQEELPLTVNGVPHRHNPLTLYVNPDGTSSECPVCGGKLRHPIWKESKCINCGVTFNRDRLSSLSISVRGLYLCGTPFAVSGSSSWDSMKNNYLHFQILNMIDGKYSVRDVLLSLSRIKIYRMEKGEIMGEIPKKAKEIISDMKIDMDILRKKA